MYNTYTHTHTCTQALAQSYYNKNLLPILSALLSVELTHLPNKQLFSVGQVCVWFHELTYKLTCTHTNTRVYARTHARAHTHTHTRSHS